MINIKGYFTISPKLTDYDLFYLKNFNITNHVKRDSSKLDDVYNGSHGYNGDYGIEGEYFIKYIFDNNGKYMSPPREKSTIIPFDDKKTIIDDTVPPSTLPNKSCPWKPNLDGTKLVPETIMTKYKNNYKWLKWLIGFLKKQNYLLNGEVTLSTNTSYKRRISLKDNKITYKSLEDRATSKSLWPKIQKKKKKENIKDVSEIIKDIITKTKNNEIIWEKTKYNNGYHSTIELNENVYMILSILLSTNILKIHLKRSNSLKLYKVIRSDDIKNLLINYKNKNN